MKIDVQVVDYWHVQMCRCSLKSNQQICELNLAVTQIERHIQLLHVTFAHKMIVSKSQVDSNDTKAQSKMAAARRLEEEGYHFSAASDGSCLALQGVNANQSSGRGHRLWPSCAPPFVDAASEIIDLCA